MAQGSIIWRCRKCGNLSRGKCDHSGGKYSIGYYVPTWDAEKGMVIRKRKWEVVGIRKREAETRLTDRLKALNGGTYRELQDITFADFADKWLKEYVQGAAKHSTWQAYDSHIRVHFKPALGALALRAMHEDTVQSYMAGKLAGGAKPKSVRNHLVILKGMLKYAVKWGYLAANPAAGVKAPRVEREEMDVLVPEEIRHLLAAKAEDGEPAIRPGWYVPIKLAIFSGLRQGEQFALQVGDLDFHAGQVRVRRQLSWDWKRRAAGELRCRFAAPKSRAGVRNVDLPPDLLEDLRRYVAGFPDQDPDRLLFATGAGTPLDPKNVVNRVFRVALTRANLRSIRWHDLRHTYASLQLAAGANIKYLSQQMGHASVQITLDRYSHLLQDSLPAQAARLSSLVFDSPGRATVVLPEQPRTPKKAVEDGEKSIIKTGA